MCGQKPPVTVCFCLCLIYEIWKLTFLPGLIILEASYGPSETDGSTEGLNVDVTVPMQALVNQSQVYIPGRRSKVSEHNPSALHAHKVFLRRNPSLVFILPLNAFRHTSVKHFKLFLAMEIGEHLCQLWIMSSHQGRKALSAITQ